MLTRNLRFVISVFLSTSCADLLLANTATPPKFDLLEITIPGGTNGAALHLRGADARQQLLVTAKSAAGTVRDWTHEVTYEATPAGVVEVRTNGLVVPLSDGHAVVTARSKSGLTASAEVEIEQSKVSRSINFGNQIVPIFTKAGCNAGGCHGKSSGQNGFKLSLLGFEPADDYDYLVREARGRRLFPGSPDRSLLLLKGTATLPHGGGKRLELDSEDYQLLRRWIAQGMPYGHTNDPVVASIEVFPKERTLGMSGEQQLAVMARYTDGSIQDVTRSALYEPNDKELAQADNLGHVKAFDQPGTVAVMVRYQAKVAVFQATIPLGAPVEHLPPAHNFIDDLVFKKLKEMGMPPSEVCDDSTFLRRATLDIAGRLPYATEVEAFSADHDSAKREKLISRLLNTPDYAEFFATQWNALLRNKRVNETQTHGTFAFYDWIRDSFIENKPFDQFAREIVAATGDIAQNPPVAWYRQVNNPNAQLEDTAQLFLGMRLQCAQCHHHPYEKWSQQDYYGLAAIFTQVARKAGSQPGEEVIYHKHGLSSATNKKTKQSVKPAALGQKPFALTPDDDPREALASWMASADNPYFARALVNRYWKHFFDRGLVEPDDDMRETNPPSNPELLQALARHFIDHHFDLKELAQTICSSQVYQLSAIPNEFNKVDKQNFSRYYPKRLPAEVLFDAVNQVIGSRSKFDGLPAGTRAVQLPDNSFNANSYFLTVFGRPDASSSCECERSQDASLAQSLHLLNAKDIQEKLSDATGRAALLAGDVKAGDDIKLRQLYRVAFAREPDEKDFAIAKAHLEKVSVKKEDKKQAYEDIIWALLNTKEFLFNH